MVKHVIIWSFREDLSQEEKTEATKRIKTELEALIDKIDGLTEIKVQTNPLASSSGDLMLDSTFVSEEALKAYQVNPDHVKAAQFVRSVVGERKCFDYEV